jgi:D-alanyl-D-alanine dipeptidase
LPWTTASIVDVSRARLGYAYVTLALLLCSANSFGRGLRNEFVDVGQLKGIQVDLRYASENNFMGENLYGGPRSAYLHKDAAAKLEIAAALLEGIKPGWNILVLDALRPLETQKRLWERVKGTELEKYVADPAKGSTHNYGFAVDATLVDANGHEVDMGTPYDSFEPLAQPKLEKAPAFEGKLTTTQLENRHLLRDALEKNGFKQLSIEWWHFDALPKATVKSQHKIVDSWEDLSTSQRD